MHVVEVAIVIARVVMNFVSDPVGSTIKLIFIILAVLLGLTLTLMHTLLTLIGVSFVLGFAWAWFMAFTISLWLTIVESIFVVILTVIFAVLWLIDLLTGGMVVRLMRCENLPNEWEFRRNLAEGNTSVRALGLAFCYPCAARFHPWGALCKRRSVYIPDYCPHQQIVSTFRNGKPFGGGYDDPVMFRGFPVSADPSIVTKQRPEKENILVDALRRVKDSLGTCYKSFSRYDYLNRHICHNIDRLPDDRYPPDVKRQLRALCYQTYCEYAPRDKGRGKVVADLVGEREGCLCSSLRKEEKPQPPPADSTPVRENTDDMFRRSLLMFLTVLALLASAYTLSNTTSSMIFRQKN